MGPLPSTGGDTDVSAEYLTQMFGLKDKVALITGARTGIGAAIAVALSKAGARVALTSRQMAGFEPVVKEITDAGGEALTLEMDVTDRDSIEATVEATHRHFGRIDILVNNAGIAIRGESLTFSGEDWDLVYDTNVKGLFHTCQAVAPLMMEQKDGRIINLSSAFGRSAMQHRAAYASSKAAVDHLTRVLAVEWAPFNICVNGVAPTTVLTATRKPMFQDPKVRAERERRIPLGRLGTTEDVVGAALFLAGPAAAFITGHTIMVDGGFTCL